MKIAAQSARFNMKALNRTEVLQYGFVVRARCMGFESRKNTTTLFRIFDEGFFFFLCFNDAHSNLLLCIRIGTVVFVVVDI